MTMVATETAVVVLAERTPYPGLAEELARCAPFRLVGRVDTPRAVLDMARSRSAEIVVVELTTGERLRKMTDDLPRAGLKLVVVSALPPEAALMPILAVGARAFLHRPVEPGVLEQALTAVAGGHRFVDPPSTGWLVQVALRGYRKDRPHGLTLRQAQVVELVAGGLTNREIGRVLGLSVATVKSHLNAAMHRLGADNRWAATARAEELREDGP